MFNRLKTLYGNHLWAGRSIVTLLAITLITIGLRLALTPGIIYGTTSWLKKQGITSSIEDIEINILGGSVSLINAEGHRDDSTLFNIDLIEIQWQWSPLSDKIIEVSKVIVDGFTVSIALFTDKVIISGIEIPLGDAAPTEEVIKQEIDEADVSWAASLGELTFTNFDICYRQHDATHQAAGDNNKILDYCSNLQEMTWAGNISYGTDPSLKEDDIPLSSTGNFTLNGLTVTDNRLNRSVLSSVDNEVTQVEIKGLNNISIAGITMESLSLLQRDDTKHKDAVRFQQLTINDISLSNMSTLAIESITVDEPGFYLVKQGSTKWEYEQWLPGSPATESASSPSHEKKNSSNKNTSSFHLAIGTVDIKDADLCYLEKTTSIYYCLTFAEFGWDGSIRYDTDIALKGDLKLIEPHIRNYSIERELLDIQSLALTGLDMKGAEDINLDKVVVKQLTALQRSEEKDDNTVSVHDIDIEKIRYTGDSVSISTITIDGLANTVSMNKDGGWEHDKWITKADTHEAGAKKSDQTENHKQDGTAMVISLDRLVLDTDKPIRFIDNSTTPVMKIGLKKLSFEADKIYSSKPDSDTLFKLSAQTSRHGTIDIAGTVRPFADKQSFDAKGKLKGFDLRPATPAAKKAIGHIIQSGQMDADLKLLAVDGVLDSSVDLSLYHFNIKAVSKKDAAEFDKKFGMPLNQTLVLLRDRDDTIHLTIPITGDVNNPNFDPTDAIISATSKAATVTLITFYTPYGLVYAGGNLAFNLATALNFDPVVFDAGSAELNEENKEQLEGLSKLMTEKPGIHLTLCGITNQQDVVALYPELRDKTAKSSSEESNNGGAPAIKLNKEQLARLNEIARQRQVNSKNYLVSQGNIEHDRLILCAPEHMPEEQSNSGVEIHI